MLLQIIDNFILVELEVVEHQDLYQQELIDAINIVDQDLYQQELIDDINMMDHLDKFLNDAPHNSIKAPPTST